VFIRVLLAQAVTFYWQLFASIRLGSLMTTEAIINL